MGAVLSFLGCAPDNSRLLPSEVWLMILDYLPAESVIAFALTSWRSYTQFMPGPEQRRVYDPETRRALLLLLERDTPHLYLCHRCNDLHSWTLPQKNADGVVAWYNRGCRKLVGGYYGADHTYEDYRIDFHVAQLVMNRHFYGEGHGPPLDALSYTTKRAEASDGYHGGYGVIIDRSWRAGIVDDELYLEASMQVHQDHGRERTFVEYIARRESRTSHLVCRHVGLGSSLPGYIIPGLQKRSGSLYYSLAAVPNTLMSCQQCCTDYLCNVKWHPLDSRGPKGWVVTVTKWLRLGGCRVLSITNDYSDTQRLDACTPLQRPEGKPGDVYRKWMSQDVGTVGYSDEETGEALVASFHSDAYYDDTNW